MSRNKTKTYSLFTTDKSGREEFRLQSSSAVSLSKIGEGWVRGGFCKDYKVVLNSS